jgi:hypothetical protein
MSQARFQKFQREKARREKAEAKAERKAARVEAAANGDDVDPAAPAESSVLDKLAALHQQFDDDVIDFDTFEERKNQLIAQLNV